MSSATTHIKTEKRSAERSRSKLVPALRFKEFERDIVQYLFENIFLFSTGKNIKQAEASPEFETPCVRYGELYHMYGEVIKEVINKTNLDTSELLFSKGDEILLPSAGEDPLDIGSASALTLDNVAIGRTINILRPKEKNIYSQIFASYYINEKLRKKISTLARGASISNVYNSDLKKLKINLPSLPEQQKTASFLSAVDEKIQQLTKKKALLEQYKKGVMQQLFSGQLRFKDENGNPYPDWEARKLGEVLLEFVEKTTESNQYPILSSTKNDIYLQSEYFTRDIASKDNTGYKILRRNQLVFSPQNLWLGNINLNVKYDIGIVSPSYKIFDFKNDLAKVLYFKDFLQTNRMMYEYAQASEQGASVVRRNLDMPSFKAIKIQLPSIEEQQKIATYLSSIDTKIEAVNNQITQTQTFKKGLLQQMFV